MTVQVFQPFELFHDINGQPVDDGYIWIGQPNLDPETNPISVFFDEALTVPAAQPIRTRNGYPSNAGAQTRLYVDATTFSIKIENKNGTQISQSTVVNDASEVPVKATGGKTLTALKTRFSHLLNLVDDFGAMGGNATADTNALIDALALGKKFYVPKLDYLLDHAVLLSVTGKTYFEVLSNTWIEAEPGARFRINSNQLADGTRLEITGTNVRINNLEINEVNGVLTRSNVYGTLAGKGCTNVLLDNVTVDGANGAGMHFRNNCSQVTLIKPKAVNTKSDGLHVQRGCSKFKFVTPYCEANEDDCIGLVSHGRNEGYNPVDEIEILGGYYGAQANGAVGSGLAVIGARNVRIVAPKCVSNGLSSIRIADFVSVPEGSYAPANVQISNPRCYFGGLTSSVTPGLVKDGITILNARNVEITNPDVVGPVGNGIVISAASIDVNIESPRVRQAGGRGIWVASSFQTAAHILELATTFGDSRYTAPAQLGTEYLRISETDVDESFNDGHYLDGSLSNSLISPTFKNLKSARSNRGNTASKFGIFILNSVDMYLDGADGGLTASATAINPIAFSAAGYRRITNLATQLISHSYPTITNGDRREFWNTTTPAGAPVAGGDYKLGEKIWNSNPVVGPGYWVLTVVAPGGAGTWLAK